jgi:hypothetical protein
MKRRSYFAMVGAVLLLGSCSASDQAQNQADPPSSKVALEAPTPATGFSNPVVKPMTIGATAAVPGLVQPTSAKARVPNISTGRADPFAQVNPSLIPANPVRVVPVSNRASALNRDPALNLPALPNAPTIAIGSPSASPAQRLGRAPAFTPLPAPPITVPASPDTNRVPSGLPSLNAPVSVPVPPVSKTALAEAIEITGAVQVQNQWMIIVKEPDSTSRYVKVGDRLANGQVMVKRVMVNPGSDPIVVLQQNGQEVTRPVGVSRAAIASAQ